MKTTLILTAMVVVCANLCAQGTVNFANGGVTPVTNSLTGDLVGTEFRAALYYLPDQANTPTTASFDASRVTIGPPVGFYSPGLFNGGSLFAPATTYPGGAAWFQVRTWENAFGTSYEQAILAPPIAGRKALAGTSNILRVGQTGSPGQTPPATLTGWGLRGFSAVSVPSNSPQGTVDFANSSSSVVSNSLTGYPVIAGTTFKTAVYYLPDQSPPPTNESRFVNQLGGSVGFGPPGFYAGGTRSTPSTLPGGFAYFVVKAWESAFGTSYESALANPNVIGGRRALVGTSNIIKAQTGENTPTLLTSFGLQGFSLVSVPTNTDLQINSLSVDPIITFYTATGHTYVVEKTLNLKSVNWQPMPGVTNIAGTGGPVSISDKGAGCLDERYYRVRRVQ